MLCILAAGSHFGTKGDIVVVRPILWVGLKTLVLREVAVIGRFWLITLAPPAVTAALYFVILVDVLGEQIGSVNGYDYLQFLTPGLVGLSAIPYAFAHTANGLLGARLFRFLEELLVAPMPRWAIAVGYVVGGVMRGFFVGALVTMSAILLCHFKLYSIWLGILCLLLITVVSALGGLVVAICAKSFEQITAVQSLLLVPLAFLGGTFVPLAILPSWAQALSLANPIFHMVNLLRCGFAATPDVHAAISILVVAVFGAALFGIALRLLPGRLAID